MEALTLYQNQFLSLIKAGLWGNEPEKALFDENTDWKEIYEISRKQTVLGIVLDGIELLPENIRPQKSLYLKWCADVISIEDANLKLNEEVVNLFNFLHDNDINPILLKGQGIAQYYRNPLHRSCGDIDIYIGKKNYEKVNELLSQEGFSYDKWSLLHMAFKWHNVDVENHRLIAHMISPIAQQRLENLVKKWLQPNLLNSVIINGNDISTPPVNFNAAYLLLHSIDHILWEGIGLRQSCDWAIFLNSQHKKIDWESVKDILEKLGILNGWKIFGAMAVKYLGLSPKDIFIEFNQEDEKEADKLIEDIFQRGNFGFFTNNLQTKKYHFIRQKWENYKNSYKRKKSLKKIAPNEAKWARLTIFKNFFSAQFFSFVHNTKK